PELSEQAAEGLGAGRSGDRLRLIYVVQAHREVDVDAGQAADSAGRRDRQLQLQLAEDVVVLAGVDVDRGTLDEARHQVQLGGVERAAALGLLCDPGDVGEQRGDVHVAVQVDRLRSADLHVALVGQVGDPARR